MVPAHSPGWRNGIRGRLKPVWAQARRGSNPLPGTANQESPGRAARAAPIGGFTPWTPARGVRTDQEISATLSELVLPAWCLGLPATITILSPDSTMSEPFSEFCTASTMASTE